MARLLWLSHFAPYPATGHGALQRTHHLLVQAARRHEVHLVALVPPGSFASHAAIQDAEGALASIAASARLFPLAIGQRRARTAGRVARSALSRSTYWEQLFADPHAQAYVRNLARAHRFDLAHLDTIFLAGYLPLLGAMPFVLNHHNIESHLLTRRAERAGKLGRWYFARQARATETRERVLGPQAAANLVVSDLDGERLREIAPGARVETIPNGVDVGYFAPDHAEPVRPASLVWAGGMDWFPNADAIEWFAQSLWPALAADRPERSAVIVGRHPPARALALAAADPRVRVLGFVDDVRPYVRQAATYICPIRVGGGTRLKVLDALAIGRPLVATRIGVEGLGLEDGVHYLEANDVETTVAQVRRVEQDPALASRLAEAGRAFVLERFSWDSVGARLAEAYGRVLDGASRVQPPSALQ